MRSARSGRGRVAQGMTRVLAMLSSLRLAIVLMVLLALAAVVGGILPQSPSTPDAASLYRSYGVFWYRVITRLSLDDIFHSIWFFVLVEAFALNLMLCTARRLMSSIREIMSSPPYRNDLNPDYGATCRIRPTSINDLLPTCRRVLRRVGYRRIALVRSENQPEQAAQIVAQRFRWSRLAPDVVHIGILLVLLGALLGLSRAEGVLRIGESDRGRVLMSCETEPSEGCVPLPFDLRVDDFGVDVYEDTVQVRDTWAQASAWDERGRLHEARISVNHPLYLENYGLYVWLLGEDTSRAEIRLHVFDRERNLIVLQVEAQIGERVELAGYPISVSPIAFYPNPAAVNADDPEDLGWGDLRQPSVRIDAIWRDEQGQEAVAQAWVTASGSSLEDVCEMPVSFLLADYRVPMTLDLRFVQSPGYGILIAGFVIVMIGLVGSFYLVPTQVWLGLKHDQLECLVNDRGRLPNSRRSTQLANAIAGELMREEAAND